MKNMLLVVILFFYVVSVQGQASNPLDDILITSEEGKTQVETNENGELLVNVSPKDVQKFRANGNVHYSDFGAVGDSKTDDLDAIAATHAFANMHKLLVKADEGATYYIGKTERTAVIQTDTDFGTAAFIVDDSQVPVEKRGASVFKVSSTQEPVEIKSITSLKRNQEKIDITLPKSCLVTVTDSNVKRYIRFGLNQNSGSPQTDIFVVDKNGNVDKNTPIIWDFDEITEINAIPIDETTLNITGGRFTTIANTVESKYTYFSRNMVINRSNVLVTGLEHRITDEGDHGAPYSGFITISNCSNVTVKNTILTGHKKYYTIGSAGKPVPMGSYDISNGRALNISFIDCSQTNDIKNNTYWGIMGSNYCKNLVYDNCKFSRFDAHMGVANATIRNSTLGHMGINAIGTGVLTVENCTIYGRNLVNLRSDYGSTWRGDFIIRNCTFVPSGGQTTSASLFGGSNSGKHDFGYTCYMPETITIESLHIDDSNHPEEYQGPAIFENFNKEYTDSTYKETYPYIKTHKVILENVTTASGKKIRVSDNPYMFRDVKVVAE